MCIVFEFVCAFVCVFVCVCVCEAGCESECGSCSLYKSDAADEEERRDVRG